MSRSTVQQATLMPSLFNWSQILSAPYTDRFFSRTRKVSGLSSPSWIERAEGG
jgi:hypothetical protein